MVCARCEGPTRIIACIEEPSVVSCILQHLGLSAVPLPTARARARLSPSSCSPTGELVAGPDVAGARETCAQNAAFGPLSTGRPTHKSASWDGR